MFWHVLRMEIDKTLKRPFFWIGLCIVAAFVVFSDSVLYTLRNRLPPGQNVAHWLTWPFSLVNALQTATAAQVGGFVLIAFIGTILAQEYSWRTMQLWLGHGVSRSMLLVAKFIVSLLPVIVIVGVALLIGGGMTAFFSYQLNGTLHIDQIDFARLLLGCVLIAYALFPYVALTFLLAVLFRSTLVAVSGSLVFVLVVETTISGLLNLLGENGLRIASYLPRGFAAALFLQSTEAVKVAAPQTPSSITVGVTVGAAPASTLASPLVAGIGIAIYTLIFYGIALLAFQRQDLTS